MIDERTGVPAALGAVAQDVTRIAEGMVARLREGGVIFACGNGGSAAQASHFVTEIVGRFKRDRAALPGFSLADNIAATTAIANDYGYEEIFARQIKGLGKSTDCLLALTTSGASPNVLHACAAARERGMSVYMLTGMREGQAVADVTVRVPLADTPRVQEAHLAIIHILCELLEDALFPSA